MTLTVLSLYSSKRASLFTGSLTVSSTSKGQRKLFPILVTAPRLERSREVIFEQEDKK